MNNRFDFNTAFRQNSDFINGEEIAAEAIEKQFIKDKRHGFLKIGEIDCPTGEIKVGDPLTYMPAGFLCPVLQPAIAPGVYEIWISVAANENMGLRICTVKMPVTDKEPVVYKVASSTADTVLKFKDGSTTDGFPVDAGLAVICDKQTAVEYRRFIDRWSSENPSGNYYDHYFADIFARSYEKIPAVQRPGGDFINWAVPGTDNRLVMCASGLGDGFYKPYWGYDIDGDICRLIIPFVNPDFFE